MNVHVKIKITYGIILFYSFCTGLEFAIILPTIWSYVHQHYNGSTSMLGIVLASYSISSFFVSPFIGWWSDRSQNTKAILLVMVVAEVMGSILYFLGSSTLMLLTSRIIAGIGGSGITAVIADIIHISSSEERTYILSIVMASRQIGLVIAPALNFFLSRLDYKIGSFPVDMFSSPGLFMAILWVLLDIVIMFGYFNLTSLKNEEDIEKLFDNFKSPDSYVPENIPYYNDLDNSSSQEVFFTSSYPPACSSIPVLRHSLSNSSIHSTSQPNIQAEWLQDNSEYFKIHSKEEIQVIKCQNLCDNYLSPESSNLLSEKQQLKDKIHVSRAGSVSDKMIESAERLIQSTSESWGNFYDATSKDQPATPSRHSSGCNPDTPFDASAPCSTPNEKTSLLSPPSSGNLRDEIVVILCLTFISLFSQSVLETILTPVAQKYYGFNEMDNSWMFLLAGLEMFLVFGLLKVLSRMFSDRLLIIMGLLALITAMGLPIIFLPYAIPGENVTFPLFIATIAINMVGVGFLMVCASSLLSKLTDEDNQALYQGYMRSMGNLGYIMGPLWGGTFLHHHHLLFIIPLVIVILITVLFICSYKKLEPSPLLESM